MDRRVLVLLAIAMAAVAASWLRADQPPASPVPQVQTSPPVPAPPAQTPAAPTGKAPSLAFASETGVLLSPILPAQAAVFEGVMEQVRQVLAKSTDPTQRQQAAGWKIYKAAEPFTTYTLYVSIMSPAVKGAEYNVFELLQASMGDAAARDTFQKFRSAFGGPQHVLNLDTVMVMGEQVAGGK